MGKKGSGRGENDIPQTEWKTSINGVDVGTFDLAIYIQIGFQQNKHIQAY